MRETYPDYMTAEVVILAVCLEADTTRLRQSVDYYLSDGDPVVHGRVEPPYQHGRLGSTVTYNHRRAESGWPDENKVKYVHNSYMFKSPSCGCLHCRHGEGWEVFQSQDWML